MKGWRRRQPWTNARVAGVNTKLNASVAGTPTLDKAFIIKCKIVVFGKKN